jgi:hypothetical protein
VVQGSSHVIGVRWEALVKIGGGGWAVVKIGREKKVLMDQLAVPALGWGRGDAGGKELREGRVVN